VPEVRVDLLTSVVAAFEAFSATVYPDPVGKPTIGFGHLLKAGEYFPAAITREEGLALLDSDLRVARASVDDLFHGVYLAPNEWDALTSFVFNVGAEALRTSTLRQRVLTGMGAGAAHEFVRWVHATMPDGTKKKLPGLVRRRDCESCWFLGAHPATVARMAGAVPEDD